MQDIMMEEQDIYQKTDNVKNIDKLAPNDFDLQVTASDSTITVSAVGTVTDRTQMMVFLQQVMEE